MLTHSYGFKWGSSVQSLSHVWLFATPWITAHQASLSITNSRSLFKLMFHQVVMPSNHLILCRPLLLPPSIFPSIRVFSNESALGIRWPKYWSFSFCISPSNDYSGLISFRIEQDQKEDLWPQMKLNPHNPLESHLQGLFANPPCGRPPQIVSLRTLKCSPGHVESWGMAPIEGWCGFQLYCLLSLWP